MAKAASRCCELANPAQVRQIASQTGDLLRRMRFVAGRGRCGGEPSGRYCRPEAQRGNEAKWKSERKSLPLRRRRCNAADAQKPLRCSRCTEAAAMQQRHRSSSAGRQKEKASKHRSLAQKKQPGTEACDPNAGCARKITIRVNILLTLRPATREATTCGAAHHLRSNNLRSSPSPAKQQPAEWPVAAAGRSAT